MAVLWFRYGGWPQSVTSFSFVVIAAVCLLGHRSLRDEVAVETRESACSDTAIHALGYDSNIALIQCVATAIMSVCVYEGFFELSRYSALVSVLVAPLLFRTSWQRIGLGLGAVSLAYFLYASNSFLYVIESNFRSMSVGSFWYDVWPPIAPYIWLVLLIGALPQLLCLSVGGVGLGRFRGDSSIRILGTDVPLAFASSLIIVSAGRAAHAVWSSPTWIPIAVHGPS
jgi:hypothetical protein